MAAYSKTRGFASVARRLGNQIWINSSAPAPAPAASFRKSAHYSTYDKNPDDQVCPSVVPDDVIQSESDKYWAPHPHTGVFGPTEQNGQGSEVEHYRIPRPLPTNGSVLEQQIWFRPLEDVDKPSS